MAAPRLQVVRLATCLVVLAIIATAHATYASKLRGDNPNSALASTAYTWEGTYHVTSPGDGAGCCYFSSCVQVVALSTTRATLTGAVSGMCGGASKSTLSISVDPDGSPNTITGTADGNSYTITRSGTSVTINDDSDRRCDAAATCGSGACQGSGDTGVGAGCSAHPHTHGDGSNGGLFLIGLAALLSFSVCCTFGACASCWVMGCTNNPDHTVQQRKGGVCCLQFCSAFAMALLLVACFLAWEGHVTDDPASGGLLWACHEISQPEATAPGPTAVVTHSAREGLAPHSDSALVPSLATYAMLWGVPDAPIGDTSTNDDILAGGADVAGVIAAPWIIVAFWPGNTGISGATAATTTCFDGSLELSVQAPGLEAPRALLAGAVGLCFVTLVMSFARHGPKLRYVRLAMTLSSLAACVLSAAAYIAYKSSSSSGELDFSVELDGESKSVTGSAVDVDAFLAAPIVASIFCCGVSVLSFCLPSKQIEKSPTRGLGMSPLASPLLSTNAPPSNSHRKGHRSDRRSNRKRRHRRDEQERVAAPQRPTQSSAAAVEAHANTRAGLAQPASTPYHQYTPAAYPAPVSANNTPAAYTGLMPRDSETPPQQRPALGAETAHKS